MIALCECGCGEPVRWRRGKPQRFVNGHAQRMNGRLFQWRALEEALWALVVTPEGCWLWPTRNGRGYGSFGRHAQGGGRAHRVVYEMIVGPIPEGLELDHACRNVSCVNPGHLEPVTHAVNMRRRRDLKLDEGKAQAIRESSESVSILTARYGISKSHVYAIRKGKAWAA